MKKLGLILICILIKQVAFSQVRELGISKFFADTSTINFSKPDSGQFIRTYPSRFITDTIAKKLQINNAYFDTLSMIFDALPDCILEIGVHTESKGPDKQNLSISQQKAKSFKGYMVNYCNVLGDHIRIKGYGENQLLNTCDDGVPCTAEESFRNRRVEIKIVGFKDY